MCIHGYFFSKNAQVIFASPKINPVMYEDLKKSIHTINKILSHPNMDYDIHIIANNDYNEKILLPALEMIDDITDTSESFMRSLQLYNMFLTINAFTKEQSIRKSPKVITPMVYEAIQAQDITGHEEKIGDIARGKLLDTLESGQISMAEIEML